MSGTKISENFELAKDFVRDSKLAEETIFRYFTDIPEARPHPACPNVLVTDTPAGLSLLEPPFRAVIWNSGFPIGNNPKLMDDYKKTVAGILAVKHASTNSINVDLKSFSESLGVWTFHDHGGDTPELAHFTGNGPGLCWLPTMEDDLERKVLTLGIVNEDADIQTCQAGQFINFLPPLIHSGPIAEKGNKGARDFALGHISPASN